MMQKKKKKKNDSGSRASRGARPVGKGHGAAPAASGAKVLVLAATLAAAGATWADVIWKTSGYGGDAGGKTSFNTGVGWSNGEAPSAENEYRWSGSSFRTPDKTSGTFVFAGKNIHFGKNSSIVFKTYGSSVVEFPDAVFGWADSDSGILWNLASEWQTARVAGQMTVQTPEATPLLLGVNRGQGNTFLVSAQFIGEAGTAIAHSHAYGDNAPSDTTGYLYLQGDNSAFKGVWQVYNHNNLKGRAGVVLVFDHANAAGGDPGAFRADAVKVWNDGALAATATACADGPFAPANRGVTLAGAARLTTVSGAAWSLGMPVTGSGALTKTGSGQVRLCAAYTAGPIAVAEGTLTLSDGFSAPDGLSVTVADSAALTLEPLTSAGLTLDGLALPAGVGFTARATSDGTVGAVTLGSGCTLGDGPYGLSLAGDWSAVAANAELAAVRIPVSVKAITAEDFVLAGRTLVDLPRVASISVREADGLQTVFVSVRPVVMLNESVGQKNTADDGCWFVSRAATWADGALPSADKDYVIQKVAYNTLRTTPGVLDYAFPGGSLTLQAGMTLAHKGIGFAVTNFVVHGDSAVCASGNGKTNEQVLAGTMLVADSAASAPVKFKGFDNQFLRIESAIRGSGSMRFMSYDANVVTSRSTLAGDNTGFTGKISVYSPSSDAHAMTLAFTRPEALGGPLASFAHDGIYLGDNCWLKPLASMTYETANRGIRNAAWTAGVDVPDGVTFNLKTTISYTGALWKEGRGTLGLGGSFIVGTPTWDATDDRVGERGVLRVEEGHVKPLSTTAFTGLKLVFGADGGLAVDAHPEDESVAQYGLFNAYVAHGADTVGSFVLEGGTLPVRIDGLTAADLLVRTPICTVPEETAAKLRGKIAFRRVRGFMSTVEEDAVTVDGAAYVRFTAVCQPKGAAFIIH